MNVTISNNKLTAVINPLGAELNSLKDGSGHEYIWEGDAKYWGKHSPVLFPIVGSLKNNSYLYNGNTYALNRHGFAREMEFSVSNQTDNSVTFILTDNQETKRIYPFAFELKLTYTLTGTTLKIEYIVINKGTEDMPFSIGGHPAFALPGTFSDYSLKFEKDEPLTCNLLDDGLLSDKTVSLPQENGVLPLNYKMFENDALIFTKLASDNVTIQKDNNNVVKVTFADFPDLGIWTKENAPFICIEPWQGYADTVDTDSVFMKKGGIKILKSGEVYNAGFTIETF